MGRWRVMLVVKAGPASMKPRRRGFQIAGPACSDLAGLAARCLLCGRPGGSRHSGHRAPLRPSPLPPPGVLAFCCMAGYSSALPKAQLPLVKAIDGGGIYSEDAACLSQFLGRRLGMPWPACAQTCR